MYHPVWDAIARHELIAAIQFGGVPGNPPTPSGWPWYFYEEYVGAAFNFASQLTNIVAEGVFDQFPSVRVTLVESGLTWLPAHMWRFDKEWRNLRVWFRGSGARRPSTFASTSASPSSRWTRPPTRVNCWTRRSARFRRHAAVRRHYPRVHAVDPETTLIEHLPAPLARKIREDNARALYRL